MSLEENWILQIDSSLIKSLKRLPRKDGRRILSEIESLSSNPFTGDIQKMKGEDNVWRRRVGSYRIFYEVISKKRAVYVYHIERRTTTTY